MRLYLPGIVLGAGGGRGLFGGWREGALVLFAERIDGRVIFRCGGATPLRRGLSTDWLETGTTMK